jgi:hypothetical protein
MSTLGWSGATPEPATPVENLQFERAEFAAPAQGQSCSSCNGAAAPTYHELNGRVFCPACRQRIEGSLQQMRTSGSMGRGLLYGLGAAIVGSIVFYAVSAITGYQFGLIAVVIGFAVGKAVRKGSGSLGGRRYQIVAVLLTYFSIASTNIPPILKYMSQQSQKRQAAAATGSGQTPAVTPAATPRVRGPRPVLALAGLVLLFGLALALPILNITHDFLGVIIIGIGLWEAWKFTRAVKIEFKGPFTVTPATPAVPIA